MKALLDTHVWLWMISTPERLSASARRLLEPAENELHLSTASMWEISLKYSIGKFELPAPPVVLLPEWIARSRVTALPIEQSHALAVAALPFHHRDPFDRMLIAQSSLEDLPIVTRDPVFNAYDVKVLSA